MIPLLRSPPFPGVPAAIAAVSGPGGEIAPHSRARLETLVGMIREAGVGGDFWSDRPARDARERALLDAIAQRDCDAPGLAEALLAPRYRDPFTSVATTAEDAVATLAEWRETIDRNRGIAAAVGMAWWKRRAITGFLWSGRAPRFARSAAGAVAAARAGEGALAVWPSRAPAGLGRLAAEAHVPLVAVEDGFVRSVGLGSNLHQPFSIVVDRQGIHYDPSRPSDLETMLETAEMSPALCRRAEQLADFIVAAGISKYGAGGRRGPGRRTGSRRTVLVPGQVEDDMSVLLGGGGLGNRELLARVRAAEPRATILFKPHPDVDAGHRKGALTDDEILAHADIIVRGEPMPAVLDRVDAVHVLTSLSGFEALLRGVEVFTHGAPFFAGWGLTTDLGPPLPRRTRRLTLAQLVAGVLILYPRYMDPVTGLPCSPEVLLRRFAEQRRPRTSWLVRARMLQGRVARAPGFRRLGT
jgi:capsular polysaccharide export protein